MSGDRGGEFVALRTRVSGPMLARINGLVGGDAGYLSRGEVVREALPAAARGRVYDVGV